jgi:hypothetical protein
MRRTQSFAGDSVQSAMRVTRHQECSDLASKKCYKTLETNTSALFYRTPCREGRNAKIQVLWQSAARVTRQQHASRIITRTQKPTGAPSNTLRLTGKDAKQICTFCRRTAGTPPDGAAWQRCGGGSGRAGPAAPAGIHVKT